MGRCIDAWLAGHFVTRCQFYTNELLRQSTASWASAEAKSKLSSSAFVEVSRRYVRIPVNLLSDSSNLNQWKLR